MNQTVGLLNRLDSSVQKISDAAQSLSVSVAVQGQKIEDLQKTMANVVLSQQKQTELLESVNLAKSDIETLKINMKALQSQVGGMNRLWWIVTGVFMTLTTLFEAAQNGIFTITGRLH